MNVTINNKPVALDEGTSLSAIAELYKVPDKGAAIALNSEIIHREDWSSTSAKEGDEILIIKAFCGG